MERKKTDSEIEQWVLMELKREQRSRSAEICVQAHDGMVTLDGTVSDLANKWFAAQAAQRVVGFARVINNIAIKPGMPITRQPINMVSERTGPAALLPPARVEQPLARTAVARGR